jgi:5-(carboxyamino)imidazole ribonucleotide synthase
MMALELELSVVVARHGAPNIADHVADDALKTPMERAFPASENQHQGGILDVSVVPARVSPTLAAQATELALRVARGLDYVGVLCVEFFVVGGQLLVNEIAPRPHNSGHYTIDACVTSQFEQQARILARLPLGDTSAMRPSVMVNLLGDAWFKHGSEQAPDWAMLLAAERVKLHLYGKAEARAGRKMGHFVVLGEAEHAPVTEVLEKALALRAAL